MTQYTIHEPFPAPGDAMARADATQFIKEGIAWLALFFPLLWLIYHRMWLVLAGFIAALILLSVGLELFGLSAFSSWATLLFSIAFAMHANDLRRWTLTRRGFAMVGAVTGKDRTECELKYFSNWPEPSDASQPVNASASVPQQKRTTDWDEVIGLFPKGS